MRTRFVPPEADRQGRFPSGGKPPLRSPLWTRNGRGQNSPVAPRRPATIGTIPMTYLQAREKAGLERDKMMFEQQLREQQAYNRGLIEAWIKDQN